MNGKADDENEKENKSREVNRSIGQRYKTMMSRNKGEKRNGRRKRSKRSKRRKVT